MELNQVSVEGNGHGGDEQCDASSQDGVVFTVAGRLKLPKVATGHGQVVHRDGTIVSGHLVGPTTCNVM